jgi:hypothetical protein
MGTTRCSRNGRWRHTCERERVGGAPPVVLLHAFFATAMSWYATVGALAEHHRVFAVDIMEEANRSRPTRVISSRDDYLQWFSD